MSSVHPRIRRALVGAALGSSLVLCTAALAQPANDTCATATLVNTFPFTDAQSVAASTATDTAAPQPSCDATASTAARFDIWYRIVPSATGILTINQGVDSIDSATQVWTNSTNDCNGTFTAVACSDPETSTASVIAGNTYFVQISYWFATGTPTGNWNTTFSLAIPPANDACANAIALTLGTPFSGDSTVATADGPTNTSTANGCSATFFGASNRTVWHTFTTGAAGIYTVSTCTNTGFDNKIAIYQGTACSGSVASVACNDDSCGLRSSVAANLQASTTYTVRLSGTGTGTAGGPYSILVVGPQGGTAPGNDDGATPEALAANTPTAGDLSAATGLSTTLATCGSSSTTGNDVWYTFTPTVAGTHTVTVCGQFDTVLSTHTSPTTASSVCNDDTIPAGCSLHGSQLTFTGVVGTPQLIRVAAVGPATLLPQHGAFTITVAPPITGACCFAGSCTVVAQTACTGESVFQGANTSCSPNPCPAPIAGDLCASPVIASIGSNLGTTLAATTEPGTTLPSGCALSRNGNKDFFFSFTPVNDGNYTFTLCNTTSGTLDTVLSIHTNVCPTTAATLITSTPNCNDDGCSGTAGPSALSNVALVGGTTYLVRVANWSTSPTAGGPFDLQITTDPFGTCCNSATGTCRLSSQPTCNGANESFQGQASCSPNPCPVPPQACCAPDGTCTFVPPASCTTPSIAQGAGTTCTPNICPAPPANDNCNTAQTVTVGAAAATGNNSAATTASGEPHTCQSSSGKGVWFDFTAPAAGTYQFDTEGSAQSDTVLSVFDVCGGTSLACDDDAGTGNLSVLQVNLTSGQNVKVLLSSFGATPAGGGYVLNISTVIAGACCNDLTGACTIVLASAGCPSGATYQGDNTTCTPSPCPASGSCCNPVDGSCLVRVEAQCATPNVWTAGAVCTPNPCPQPPPPANDTCAAAVTLNAGANTGTVNNDIANNENIEPLSPCNLSTALGIANSVWYTFTPAANGTLAGSIDPTTYDGIAVLYSGSCGALTEVACWDEPEPFDLATPDSGSSALTAGVTYYLVIGDWGTSEGGGVTNYSITLPDAPATGRCCIGARCAIVLQAACTPVGTAGASYTAGAADCNASGILNAPCCFADYNKAGGVTVQDIFDFLSDYFTGSVNANVSGDGVTAPTVQDIFDFLGAYFAGGC